MASTERFWLLVSAALACGEGVAALLPRGADAWPAPLLAAIPVALIGYGLSVRGWLHAVVFLAGLALFWSASVDVERDYRVSPWKRDARRNGRPALVQSELRRDLLRRSEIGLSHNSEAAALNKAMLLGERAAMPRGAKKVFVESGAIHVFAISGLHVMVVARVLLFISALVFVPYRFQGVAAIPAVWGYVFVVGTSPSAVRAALMATFYSTAPLLWRRPSGVVSLALSFTAVHVVNPRQIVDTGSQLSFIVMLAIVMAARVSRRMRGEWRKWLCVAVAAWAAGVPVAAAVFGRVTPGGLLANLFLIAAAGYSVAAGAVGIIASFFSDTLASHFNNLSALATDFMVLAARLVAEMPFACVELEKWGLAECVEWYAALALSLLLVWMAGRRRDLV